MSSQVVGGSRGTSVRWALCGALVVTAALLSSWARTEATTVPPQLQAELLSKLSHYDRGFRQRVGDLVRIVVLVKPDSVRSDVSGGAMKVAFAELKQFGGLPHEQTVVPFESADALVKRCTRDRVAVVYVAQGFEDELERLRTALVGVDVLTVAALPEYVPKGVVLGFEIRNGKPKMVINHAQAKLQKVSFSPSVLKLMRVVSP